MSTFIIFSFIVHFISLFAIVVLYMRQNRYVESEKEMKRMKTELEEVLQSYLLEIQEENKMLLANVNTSKQQSIKQVKTEPLMEQNIVLTKDQEVTPKIPVITKAVASQAYESALKINKTEYIPPFENVKDQLEVTIEQVKKESCSQKKQLKNEQKPVLTIAIDEQENVNEIVKNLVKEGYSTEEIAKKLHKGKTEIELMLKFYSEIT